MYNMYSEEEIDSQVNAFCVFRNNERILVPLHDEKFMNKVRNLIKVHMEVTKDELAKYIHLHWNEEQLTCSFADFVEDFEENKKLNPKIVDTCEKLNIPLVEKNYIYIP
ncbi:hypothetical protein MHB75_11925 [Kurthia sp. FSL E2-0154]|uniref:hypothetical protein n=1 Tax=Kurthia sp. FSL E2-0154 TaxID=2921358 RepID=UPI0030F6E8C3